MEGTSVTKTEHKCRDLECPHLKLVRKTERPDAYTGQVQMRHDRTVENALQKVMAGLLDMCGYNKIRAPPIPVLKMFYPTRTIRTFCEVRASKTLMLD